MACSNKGYERNRAGEGLHLFSQPGAPLRTVEQSRIVKGFATATTGSTAPAAIGGGKREFRASVGGMLSLFDGRRTWG